MPTPPEPLNSARNGSIEPSSRLARRIGLALLLCATTAAWGATGIQVKLDDRGRLSLQARDADVMDVLEAITKRAGIHMALRGARPQLRGSWSFSGLPLEQGLERVLGGIGHVIVRRPGSVQAGQVESLWLLTDPAAMPGLAAIPAQARLVAAPAEIPAPAVDDLETLLDRIAAVDTPDDPDAVGRLTALLNTPDPLARSTVAAALGHHDDEHARQALAQLLYQDPTPQVRRDAADALAESGPERAAPLLRKALQDPDPGVRMHVDQLIQGLSAP